MCLCRRKTPPLQFLQLRRLFLRSLSSHTSSSTSILCHSSHFHHFRPTDSASATTIAAAIANSCFFSLNTLLLLLQLHLNRTHIRSLSLLGAPEGHRVRPSPHHPADKMLMDIDVNGVGRNGENFNVLMANLCRINKNEDALQLFYKMGEWGC